MQEFGHRKIGRFNPLEKYGVQHDDIQEDNEEKQRFMQFLLSGELESVKADAIIAHWAKFCKSKADILTVFHGVDIIHILLHDRNRSGQIIPFICYSIVKSKQIRQAIISLLVQNELSRSLSGYLCVSDIIMMLASCSIDIVTDDEMTILLDYSLSLPDEYLLEKLVVLTKLAQSLPFVCHDHAIKLRLFLNRLVSSYLIGDLTVDEKQKERFGRTVSSIAKTISGLPSDSNCFRPEIWAPFLHEFLLDHDIIEVCKRPFVIDDATMLPYFVKSQIATVV